MGLLQEKENEYTEYVIEHTNNVMEVCRHLCEKIKESGDFLYDYAMKYSVAVTPDATGSVETYATKAIYGLYNYIVLEFNKNSVNIKNFNDVIITLLTRRATMHDLCKFSSEEFDAYRAHFYPMNTEEKNENKDAFELAWKHHYLNSPHHWDFWANEGGKPMPMDIISLLELVCDWEAMGKKFGNTIMDYYEKNKDKIIMNDETRAELLKIIEIL